MSQFTYLIINISCILIPFFFSFYKQHAFYKEWKYFFPANFAVAVFFLIWDFFFTKWGVWGFNPNYLTGIYIANLPLEEVLFFICIPYACVFTYFAFEYIFPKRFHAEEWSGMYGIVIVLMIAIAVLNFQGLYTFYTFLFLSVYFLLGYLYRFKIRSVLLCYLAILPFFFLSNGILTGSFLKEPVVWYNNAENMGIRMWSIPLEDLFYGFLLVAMNIGFYQYFKMRFSHKLH